MLVEADPFQLLFDIICMKCLKPYGLQNTQEREMEIERERERDGTDG